MNKLLTLENIRRSAAAKSKQEAIAEAGSMLIEQGYVQDNYLAKMYDREALTSTYMGNLLAIPHGTNEAKDEVLDSGLVILTYDQPIDWDGHDVRLVIGIAGKGNEHLELLSKIAIACSELANVEKLLQSQSAEALLRFFTEISDG